jgi:nucleotide-binding universal stress UspA family protein
VVGAAYDGSDEAQRALEAAQALAARAAARLRIITVHEPIAFGAVPTSMLTPDVSVSSRTMPAASTTRPSRLGTESSMSRVISAGGPWEVLTEASEGVDLLVTGSRGCGPVGAVLLGSTTRELLRTGVCPLLVTPGRHGWTSGLKSPFEPRARTHRGAQRSRDAR